MGFLLLGLIATALQGQTVPPPAYSAHTILPNSVDQPAPLAPGMIVSVYGQHLGPATACTGSPDAQARETPHPLRPHQALVEVQVFPKRLCDTEVRVGGVAAGLLYVSDGLINFKVPQETPVTGTTEIRVFYKGTPGPLAILQLARTPHLGPAAEIAREIWSGLQAVQWDAPYPNTARACTAVPPHSALRYGLWGHAYYCTKSSSRVIAESFYYPVDRAQPVVLLRRADFRLAREYPAMSADVEQLLRQRLTRAYGPGAVPDYLFEIGANRPHPGLSWRAGNVTIFLHRNRNHVAPAGVRLGVVLIAVHQEILDERERSRRLEAVFRSSVGEDDLQKELGALYLAPRSEPSSETGRARAERETKAALVRILSNIDKGDRGRRAAFLVAADSLTVHLGSLLVARFHTKGAETIAEAPTAAIARRQLARYGVKYTGPGHYSGALEYDRRFLRQAWSSYPETPWGQRAYLMLQKLSCTAPNFGCEGPNCFREVIRQGEKFLREYPQTPFLKEQTFHLALAYETWWSLARAVPGDPTAEGAKVDKSSAEAARKRAIELYEELIRTAPESRQARWGQRALPRLRLGLATGERAFFCYSC